MGLASLQSIIQTYQEIAATRMQRVKDSVLHNRNFLADLQAIYLELRYSYVRELGKIIQQRKRHNASDSDYSILTRTKGSVAVFLSANTKLYGDIIRKTFNLFHEEINHDSSDIVIVGKVGLQMYKEAKIEKPYTYFELKDGLVEESEFRKVIDHINQYNRIRVFHGKFEDILSQLPTETAISGDNPDLLRETESTDTQPATQRALYLFEPSLEDILIFFETEILASILKQTVDESSLSKFTSRMISLDAIVENITTELKKAEFTQQWIKHKELNRKQLDSLAGLSLWTQ